MFSYFSYAVFNVPTTIAACLCMSITPCSASHALGHALRRFPVGLSGFEPLTPALSAQCSNLLSYRPRRRLPCRFTQLLGSHSLVVYNGALAAEEW